VFLAKYFSTQYCQINFFNAIVKYYISLISDKHKLKRTPKTMSDEQIYWPRPKSSSGRSCLSEMEDSDEPSGCFGCKRTKKSTKYVLLVNSV